MYERQEVWEIDGEPVRVTIRRGSPAVWVLSKGELLVSLSPKLTREQVGATLAVLRRQLEDGTL